MTFTVLSPRPEGGLPLNKIKRKLELLKWHAYYDGWPFTMRRMTLRAASRLGLKSLDPVRLQESSDLRFDRRFQVQTSGVVQTDQLDVPDHRRTHAVEYLPTSATALGWLLAKLPMSHSDFAFVDMGSGKGRMLLIASEFPFQRVIGVELALELHEIAEQNILRFRSRNIRCRDVQAIHQDATEFEFPNQPLVLFLFNPFSAEILRPVVDRLVASLQAEPRQVYVIYHNPQHGEIFQQTGTFQECLEDLHPGNGWTIYTNNFTGPESRDSDHSRKNSQQVRS